MTPLDCASIHAGIVSRSEAHASAPTFAGSGRDSLLGPNPRDSLGSGTTSLKRGGGVEGHADATQQSIIPSGYPGAGGVATTSLHPGSARLEQVSSPARPASSTNTEGAIPRKATGNNPVGSQKIPSVPEKGRCEQSSPRQTVGAPSTSASGSPAPCAPSKPSGCAAPPSSLDWAPASSSEGFDERGCDA